MENDTVNLLWDITFQCKLFWDIQCDNVVDIVAADQKGKSYLIVDIAIPADVIVGEKGAEQIGKQQDFQRKIGRIWILRSVNVIPVVFLTLGRVTKGFDDLVDKLETKTYLLLT